MTGDEQKMHHKTWKQHLRDISKDHWVNKEIIEDVISGLERQQSKKSKNVTKIPFEKIKFDNKTAKFIGKAGFIYAHRVPQLLIVIDTFALFR